MNRFGRPIRIALPKGRILAPLKELLVRAGYPAFAGLGEGRELARVDETNGIEAILLKDSDVATYVEYGAADLGVAGTDRLLETGVRLPSPFGFPFGRCRFCFIRPEGNRNPVAEEGSIVATKYPGMTRQWLEKTGSQADVVVLSGSIELAPQLGLADSITDLVETGGTIRAHHLEIVEVIAGIEPRLILNPIAPLARGRELRELIDRLERSAKGEGA